MANEKKAGLLNASARDGVQYRRASLFQMIVGTANAGTGVIFYLILGFASLIGPPGIRHHDGVDRYSFDGAAYGRRRIRRGGSGHFREVESEER